MLAIVRSLWAQHFMLGSNGTNTVPDSVTEWQSRNTTIGKNQKVQTVMLKELIQSAGSKPGNTVNGKSKLASLVNASPAVNARRAQPASVAAPKVEEPSDADIDAGSEDTFGDEEHDKLRARFVEALTAHCKATAPLSEVVAEMIAADVERDEAIEWGIEAGLSEGYVRSTVSSLYIALTGKRQVKAGGGRKANKGARAMAVRALKECETIAEAKALLLAARRLIEKWEKAGTVEAELAKEKARE